MIQVIAAGLSIVFGLVVAILGQERRAKPTFVLLCASCAVLTLGHLAETTMPSLTMAAARVVMVAAVVAAAAGALSSQYMMGRRPSVQAWVLIGLATLINAATVVLTDWYFTGEIASYGWGQFARGRLLFLANPLSVSAIALYALASMALYARRAHSLERNRVGFYLLAYSFLSLSLLDYLPHFGIDLFGGLVSGIAVPLFLAAFGYASLRYRTIEFPVFMGKALAQLVALAAVAGTYAAILELGRRMGVGSLGLGIFAAATSLAAYAALGGYLPSLAERLARSGEPEYRKAVEDFSVELMKVLDEAQLGLRAAQLCQSSFRASSSALIQRPQLEADEVLRLLVREETIIEEEIVRRRYGHDLSLSLPYDILVPLIQGGDLLGALALGKSNDGRLYPSTALQSLRALGNMLALALLNARAVQELQKRHRLDRYLPPQVVDSVLSGGADLIDRRSRSSLTVFFSDLKDFTGMSDRMDPEDLAGILNEYLSEMAQIAFRHGGTVDKFIGDAVMVFFGAPCGTEEAAQARACVRMGLDMQRRLAELNEQWLAKGLLYRELACRMGIHSGVAIVGSFGSLSRVDYTAIGSTVNLASRLEGKCTPGRLMLSAATRALVGDAFVLEPKGQVEVKGFARPVEVWEADPAVNP